jgi:hypothetical protein
MRLPGRHLVQAFDNVISKVRKLHPINDFVDVEFFELNDRV